MLHVRRFGAGPQVTALHGFSLTGEQFAPATGLLDHTIIAPDLPGHGSSRAQPTDLDSVLASVETLLGPPGTATPLIGYSQGARLALLTAVEDPTEISALVLISGSAGIRDVDARRARIEQDHNLADRITTIGVEAFIDSWTTAGITSLDHLSTEYRSWDRSIRSENTSTGLAAALRGYGQGAQPSVWDELGRLSMPVLLVTGSRDERYSVIASEMAALIPMAEMVVIEGAGHNPMADRAQETFEAVSGFLNRNS